MEMLYVMEEWEWNFNFELLGIPDFGILKHNVEWKVFPILGL
jgi:hypothetical protein